MARGLVWSPEAVEDIESIARFIERDSVWHARAVASKIVETAESIPDFPDMGELSPKSATWPSASGLRITTESSTAWSKSGF